MKGSTTPTIHRAILSLDIMYLVVREIVHNRFVFIKNIESKLMLANPLTKSLPPKLL